MAEGGVTMITKVVTRSYILRETECFSNEIAEILLDKRNKNAGMSFETPASSGCIWLGRRHYI